MTQRSVAKVVPAVRTVEGGGFVAPDHPHRGFETVTYMLEGAFEHQDSSGGGGYLGPGDVQWMTAGAGIVHSELPAERIRREGGRVHGLQLWVNLPRADKMSPPRYQEINADEIPVTEPAPGARVKVVAGEVFGVRGPVDVHSPIVYLHVTLQAGAAVDVPVPDGHQAFAYVISGRGQFGADETEASESQLVLFADDQGDVHLAGPDDLEGPLEALVISGVPLREPVARYGPFVMNTRAELVQAVEDYQSGAMGRIAATS
jgi:redox-sensitive bicupin YhaK (pirin superfamily)